MESSRRTDSKLRERNPRWSGGRWKDVHGYIWILVGNNIYRKEHRLVMERVLGRSLLKTEVVHHKNHIKNDNRPENLEVVRNQAEHMSRHKAGRLKACMSSGAMVYRRPKLAS